jgi:hypothetical protein
MFSLTDRTFNVTQLQNSHHPQFEKHGNWTARSRSTRKGDPSPHRTANYYKNLVSSKFLKPRQPLSRSKGQRSTQPLHDSARKLRKSLYHSRLKKLRRSGKREPMNTPVENSKEYTPGIMMPTLNNNAEPNMISKEGKRRIEWR